MTRPPGVVDGALKLLRKVARELAESGASRDGRERVQHAIEQLERELASADAAPEGGS